jgi:hypothetical protein
MIATLPAKLASSIPPVMPLLPAAAAKAPLPLVFRAPRRSAIRAPAMPPVMLLVPRLTAAPAAAALPVMSKDAAKFANHTCLFKMRRTAMHPLIKKGKTSPRLHTQMQFFQSFSRNLILESKTISQRKYPETFL